MFIMTNVRRKNRTNGWLLLGAIVLATLIILWLTIFEYWGAVEEGEMIRVITDSISVE